MSARTLLAAADKIEARIVEAEKMRAALEEIKRLHARSVTRPGMPGAVAVCALCCLDTGGYRTDECIDSHEHTTDGPVCSTTEIIARAGL